MAGRLLAIGDIHGCDRALDALLNAVRPDSDDHLVILGDVVDRGPDVRRCVDLLIEQQATTSLSFLLGNHEEMLFASAKNANTSGPWMGFGGFETLSSYGLPIRFEKIPEAHWEFLRSGLSYCETQSAIFVHANLEPNVPLQQQSPHWLRWMKLESRQPAYCVDRRVICGHTAMHDGKPYAYDGWVDIDTWCYGGGWLTLYDVENDLLWQARASGELQGPMPLKEIAVDRLSRSASEKPSGPSP